MRIRTGMLFRIVVGAVLLISITVFAEDGKVVTGDGFYTNISPHQLAWMLKSKDFFLINTHIPYEGEIQSTDAFIPFDETQVRLNEYPSYKEAAIVLYCRSGRMSAQAARDLVKAGFKNVSNLEGGMIAWVKQGYYLKPGGTGK